MSSDRGTNPSTSGQGEYSVRVRGVSKIYHLYDRPQDRLRQAFLWGRKKLYRDFWALRDVSFDLKRGETMAIIGRNGSGKSTMLQILAGVLQPSAGEVFVNGRVGALLELGSGFNPEYTGRENVYLNGAILGISRSQMERRFDEILSFADIGQFIDQPVKTYSSGMFVRLAFAVTTCVDADVLLIDEALAVGDVFFRQKCYDRLETLRQQGVSIILVSHAMNDVEQFCRGAVLLDRGRELFNGPAGEAVRRYYLLEQEHLEQAVASAAATSTRETDEGYFGQTGEFWPAPGAFVDLSDVTQVSNDWARCTALALCDETGRPAGSFEQGSTASFFTEYELLRDIEVPITGVLIQNDKGIIIHGKNSLQHDTEVPIGLPAGSRVRFRQDIALEIAPGEYTFEVGLVTLPGGDYQQRHTLSHVDLHHRTLRLCHLPTAGHFAVTFNLRHGKTHLIHYGAANLPGNCRFVGTSSPALMNRPAEPAANP
jgi:lipopolysaccharide transport system ATP-binding protein